MSGDLGLGLDARPIFDALLRQFHASPQMDTEAAWDLLSAAHIAVSYTHLRAHETPEHLVCRLLLEKKKKP